MHWKGSRMEVQTYLSLEVAAEYEVGVAAAEEDSMDEG